MKSYNTDDSGWYQIDVDFGIIMEVIEVGETFEYYDKRFRCYDLVVFWCRTDKTNTVPDIMIEHYSEFVRRLNGKRLR
jgi:hypothetical protein